MTYEETLDFLYHLEVERMDLKLERVAVALRLCGAPHLRFPSLHIAGTNGKGSTATFLHSALSAGGYKVGLFTSPHLVDFCERIRVGTRLITPEEVVEGVASLRAVIEPAGVHLTPFEMMTLLAFQTFAEQRVDVAVVEVGLGGRLDATNVLSPLVTAITSIGLDHQAYLGPTLAHIAREKGGIIKPKIPVVLGTMAEESRTILCDLAVAQGSPMLVAGRDFSAVDTPAGGFDYTGPTWQVHEMPCGLRGRFQHGNAAVALAVLESIHTAFPLTEACLRRGFAAAAWPGRLQIVSEQPFVVLDGAHNPQAMEMLCAELPALLQGRRAKVLFGVMRDKDWHRMLPRLAQEAAEVIVTRVQQARSEDPFALQAALASLCPTRAVRVREDARDACRQLLTEIAPDEALVICGSLFLVGEVLPLFPPACVSLPR